MQEPTEKSKDNLKNYIDLAGVILVAINRGGNITLLNKKGYEVLGYEEGELIGKNWFDVCIPKENRKELKNVFKALII
ncbi:MAG: PAS domain-containing protein [Candidatus Thorarchaeota archaeon]